MVETTNEQSTRIEVLDAIMGSGMAENSKIPDYSKELENRVSANADALITVGLKELS